MRYLSPEEANYIYGQVAQRFGVAEPAAADGSLLRRILDKPMVMFEGEELYPEVFTKAAVLVYCIITGKPFPAANEAAGLLCGLFLLRANGYNIAASQDSLSELAENVAAGKLSVDNLVNWFRGHVSPA